MSENPQTAKAELEMRLDGSLPQGVLSFTEGGSFPFSGWTELAAAIQAWRAQAAGAKSQRKDDAHSTPAERRP